MKSDTVAQSVELPAHGFALTGVACLNPDALSVCGLEGCMVVDVRIGVHLCLVTLHRSFILHLENTKKNLPPKVLRHDCQNFGALYLSARDPGAGTPLP